MSAWLSITVCRLVRAFFWLVGRLPRPVARTCCRLLALLAYVLDFRHRRIGLINLKIAFPEAELSWRRRVLRESFLQLADLAIEISRLDRLSREDVEKRIRYEAGRGLENYRRARQSGLGVIFVTAHFSAWELLPLAHALLGAPLSFVVRPLDNPCLEKWLNRLRCQFGNRTISKNRSLRRVLGELKRGRDVGFLIDQNVQPRDGVFVPLFGRQACTTAGPAALALRTGAPIVAGFLYPSSTGHYTIRFYPPLRLRPTGNRERDLREGTALLNRYLEEMIREFPHCWLWGHRRFRTQPEGTSPYGDQTALGPGLNS